MTSVLVEHQWTESWIDRQTRATLNAQLPFGKQIKMLCLDKDY
jgi:hypothetical protein